MVRLLLRKSDRQSENAKAGKGGREVAPKMTGQGLTLMEVCAYDRPYGEF